MRRSLTDERSHTTAEALALLGELGEVARQSMPGNPAPEEPPETSSPATAEHSSSLPAAFTYAKTNAPVQAQAPTAPELAEPGYTTRPEYQAALQDSSVIQALLALMPAEKPKPGARARATSSVGFESPRPPSVEIEPKPLTPGRASRNHSVFKLK